jgi:SNF2 family DNA or RNA helicase
MYEAFNKKFDKLLAMTGTLITGKPYSAYPALHIIEPRYYTNFKAFQYHHTEFDMEGKPSGWKNLERLGMIIKKHAVAADFKTAGLNCHDPILQFIPCEMPYAVEQAYLEFEEKGLLELQNSFLESANGGVHSIRCRQLLAHPETFDPSWGKINSRDSAVLEQLQTLDEGERTIIFSALVPEQERIARKLKDAGYRVGLINGNVPATERAKIDLDFRQGRLDTIVGSPATMSVGFNWEFVNTVIFASLDYQEANFKQAWARADRGTRTRPVRILVLTYSTRIEYRIWDIVKEKQRLSSAINT